jgi:hypothetical protein
MWCAQEQESAISKACAFVLGGGVLQNDHGFASHDASQRMANEYYWPIGRSGGGGQGESLPTG